MRNVPGRGRALAEAAVPVCSDAELSAEMIEAALAALVDEGALSRRELPTGGVRYEWQQRPESEGLDDGAAQLSKAKWFIGYLQGLRPRLSDADQAVWQDQIELDHEDIHASIEWGLNRPRA